MNVPRPVLGLHLRSSHGRHGPERALTELIPALRRFNVETSVLVLYRRPVDGPECHPWLSELEGLGVNAAQIEDASPLSIEAGRRLAWRVRRSQANVLHTHDYKSNLLGGIVARRVDGAMPWVATVHLHTATTRRLRVYRALDLFLLRLADRVITVSRDQRRLLLKRGVDRRRIVLMPNVIDARAFAHGAGDAGVTRAQLGLEPAGQVVVLVGRLTRQKGPDILIDAAEMVLARRTGVTFVVAGDGPLRAELEAAVRQRALGRSVRFLGYRKDVASLFAASDIVAMPSRSEGHPVALLEALALARPVVATRVGGIEDIIVHGESGWLVPPEHPECLADALVALLDDAEMARRLGDAGRRVVQRDCAPERAARRLATVYRTVLAEREA